MVDFNTAYRAAVEKETDIRDTSYLPEVPWVVAGIPLRWLTPLDYKILEDARNSVIFESWPVEEIPLQDVAAFFWFMHVDHDPKRRGFMVFLAKRIFVRQIAQIGVLECAIAARKYLTDNMQDSPGSSGGAMHALPVSWIAILCDAIASEYGWDDEVIVRKPIARLFQYLKRIDQRADPHAPTFNPSDAVKNMLMEQR